MLNLLATVLELQSQRMSSTPMDLPTSGPTHTPSSDHESIPNLYDSYSIRFVVTCETTDVDGMEIDCAGILLSSGA